jgi:glycerophosphoryl diester phosphodiesterase
MNMGLCAILACVLTLSARAGPTPAWWRHELVAHALGGIEGFTYTNSRDALVANYKMGHRVFEVDLQTTGDGVVVARHDWTDRLAVILEQPELRIERVPNYGEFSKAKINRRFSAISFEQILDFLRINGDIWLVTDTKSTSLAAVTDDFARIAKAIGHHAGDLESRLVVQIYNQEMLEPVRRALPRADIAYTLYQSADSNEEVIRFCLHAGIVTVVISPERYTEEFACKLAEAGLGVFVHTINRKEDWAALRSRGAKGVYTDFLIPESAKPDGQD